MAITRANSISICSEQDTLPLALGWYGNWVKYLPTTKLTSSRGYSLMNEGYSKDVWRLSEDWGVSWRSKMSWRCPGFTGRCLAFVWKVSGRSLKGTCKVSRALGQELSWKFWIQNNLWQKFIFNPKILDPNFVLAKNFLGPHIFSCDEQLKKRCCH